MKFGISITIDKKAEHKSHLIIALSEALKEYFQDKNYGEDIKDYIIGCICILPPEGFEKFNKPKKPLPLQSQLSHGVMVALQFLVLSVVVRIRLGQQLYLQSP